MSAVTVVRSKQEPVAIADPAVHRFPSAIIPGGQPPSGLKPAGEAMNSPVSSLRAATDHREVCAIARGTVQAAIEVLAGTRPVHQLARRLDQQCLAALQHRAALIRLNRQSLSPSASGVYRNPAVRSVRASEVTADIYEASAVVVDETRARAVALRLERNNKVWRITVLEIG